MTQTDQISSLLTVTEHAHYQNTCKQVVPKPQLQYFDPELSTYNTTSMWLS